MLKRQIEDLFNYVDPFDFKVILQIEVLVGLSKVLPAL
jgi:hypothetical protein